MLSNSCKYAIRSVIYLALYGNDNNKIGSKEVATNLNIPKSFLAKILQELSRKHIISSSKGPKGGFYLTEIDLKKSVLDIVACIDGLKAFDSCFLGLHTCTNEKPCSVHNIVRPFKDEIFLQLSKNTIEQFADDIRTGKSFISLDEI